MAGAESRGLECVAIHQYDASDDVGIGLAKVEKGVAVGVFVRRSEQSERRFPFGFREIR